MHNGGPVERDQRLDERVNAARLVPPPRGQVGCGAERPVGSVPVAASERGQRVRVRQIEQAGVFRAHVSIREVTDRVCVVGQPADLHLEEGDRALLCDPLAEDGPQSGEWGLRRSADPRLGDPGAQQQPPDHVHQLRMRSDRLGVHDRPPAGARRRELLRHGLTAVEAGRDQERRNDHDAVRTRLRQRLLQPRLLVDEGRGNAREPARLAESRAGGEHGVCGARIARGAVAEHDQLGLSGRSSPGQGGPSAVHDQPVERRVGAQRGQQSDGADAQVAVAVGEPELAGNHHAAEVALGEEDGKHDEATAARGVERLVQEGLLLPERGPHLGEAAVRESARERVHRLGRVPAPARPVGDQNHARAGGGGIGREALGH